MSVQLPAFVISLRTAAQRRERIEKHFNKIGLAFEWYDAVYGKDLSDSDMQRYCDMKAVEAAPHWLTRSAIGCALSHYNVYREIISRQLPYALIFEDDVVIQKDFLQHLDHLLSLIKNNEIVSFFYQSWEPIKLDTASAVTIYKSYNLYEPKDMRQPISAAAYLITLDACKTLTEAIIPIKRTSDSWGEFMDVHAYQHFRCVYPRPVDVVDAKSTIQYLNDSWKANLMKWVDKNKVFPIYQMLRAKRKRSRMKMMNVELV